MRQHRSIALRLIVTTLCVTAVVARDPLSSPVYPKTRKSDTVETLHGVEVADPYRWLEDPNSAETKAWIADQNKLTFGLLDQIPLRQKINARLTELWNYERFGSRGNPTPFKRGQRYFMFMNNGLQDQDVLYMMDRLDGTPTVLLDPNTLSKDGTVSLGGVALSKDGAYLAYGLSSGGSDWQEWHVREVATRKDLADHLKWVKFSDASWTHDGKGFFYSRYDAPKDGEELHGQNRFHKLYYHALGTPQAADTLIYEREDHDDWGFAGEVTDDGAYLIITVWRGTERRNLVFYKDLRSPTAPVVELIKAFEASYTFVDNDGTKMWFLTDHDAPRNQLIAIDVTQPTDRKTVIREAKKPLEAIDRIGDHFVATYLQDAHSMVRVLDMQGRRVREIDLPGIGSVQGLEGSRKESETFYSYTSFTTPPTIYRYDVATGNSTLCRQPKVAFNPDDYVTEQVFYNSTDGTRVPMFITFKKGLQKNGQNPTYLYGYGGFNISITPRFSVSTLVWMEMGGIYAVANLRGGGEYGKMWHEGGMKLQKQNVFDDFHAAGEYLVKQRYTSSSKLAIGGASNGGLLVGACLTQRPELYAAAVPSVGVLDMLRFHKFTIGWAWTSDYGSPDDPEEFKALLAYSPLHNIKAGTHYPATMVITGDHDDRVVPAHSFKFASALQAAQSGPNPVLIRIETRAGHGAGKPTTMQIDEAADKWAFLLQAMNPN